MSTFIVRIDYGDDYAGTELGQLDVADALADRARLLSPTGGVTVNVRPEAKRLTDQELRASGIDPATGGPLAFACNPHEVLEQEMAEAGACICNDDITPTTACPVHGAGVE